MSRRLSDEDISNVLTLNYLLCSRKKAASIKYLDEMGKICKTEDSILRKSLYKNNMHDFLEAIK